ncbi:MAG: DNA mismatch repair protein MutS [Hyphomicrobiaceae bacterium]|nr:DNA mismatch repair protein MutS [Hyphomicrobiaceae bacterium]
MSHGARKSRATDGVRSAADGDDAPQEAARDGAPPPGVTPSMAQFLEIKVANPDCLLFYRMGDFYELFFEDAVAAAEALGIVLTKRGKHLGQDIPMCGVPIHRADEYLQRLIAQGFRVAVCEQLEDPAEARKRGSKAVVKRDVVRLVTPGTLTEDSLLDARTRNYLTALCPAGKGAGATVALASLDISTGEFEVGEIAAGDFPGEIVRLSPGEVLAADTTLGAGDLAKWVEIAGAAATPVPAASFDAMAGARLVKEQLGVADLAAFGSFSKAELAAIGALLKYVDLTQLGARPPLRPPRRSGAGRHLVIDAPSRASLELVRAASGDKRSSLLGAMDRTVTGPGARELAARLASPLREAAAINLRLDDVEFLAGEEMLRGDLRRLLRRAPDLARAASRLALKRGGPRDLGAVRDALLTGAEASRLLAQRAGGIGLPDGLVRVQRALAAPAQGLREDLVRALVEEPPYLRRDGSFVREGYRADLDEARALRDDSRKVMAGLEARYIEACGVRALKVRHNNILGYYIEVPAGSAKPLQSEPHAQLFRHRQTMAGAVRFTTDELAETEARIVSAAERSLAIEQEVFEALSARIGAETAGLAQLAQGLADLDCEAALAELAVGEGYVRPVLSEDTAFDIRGGRHPVVEQALKAQKAQAFIANDCVLVAARPEVPDGFEEDRQARLWLVTGPNMAGKSTFLRQNALIAVMAQMGSFVPAASAHIGIVDRLFSRVGASDDLARGRSTFMVEMVETAAILNQAGERSLVILDEIGRGTATYDGLSIAWAVVEYLHDVSRCRALFATHYHELTALAQRLSGVANVSMEVREWRDEIVFLHKVKAGAADRSYGIQVGKLAGLPKAVTRRAKQVLERLEKERGKGQSADALVEELPLFAVREPAAAAGQPAHETEAGAVETALALIDPDELTPKAALEALYRLKALASGGEA